MAVASAVTLAVELPRLATGVTDQRFVSPSTDLSQSRVFLDLDSPALIVRQD
jgi:hypothetical protein